MGTKVYDNALDLITFSRASGGTYLDSDGLLKTASTNVPRIEYAADGTVKGLLIEEQRTNLVTYSEQFDNAVWVKNRATVSANVAIAPDGETTADKLVEDSSTGLHRTYLVLTGVIGQVYTFSVFCKASERSRVRLQETSSAGANFDLSAGAVLSVDAGVSASILNAGNGFYSCSISYTETDTSNVNQIQILDGVSNVYAGDGTSGIYIWGAQLEAGAFPTSYIPTSGATATRAADIASIPVSAFGYNQKAGTVVVEASSAFRDPSTFPRIWDLGAVINTASLWFNTTAVNLDKAGVGTLVTRNWDMNAKIAAGMAEGDLALSVDGASVGTSSGTFDLSQVGQLTLGSNEGGTNQIINGHIKSIQYYPRRLTNTQLQELTA